MENKFFETIFAKYHSRIGRISQKGCDFQINKKNVKQNQIFDEVEKTSN